MNTYDNCDAGDIDVQELVNALTRDDLRDLRDEYRNHWSWQTCGKRPFGMRFGAWVRDRLSIREMDNRMAWGDL